jgi:cobyrinic acid a,c-diamide synthase
MGANCKYFSPMNDHELPEVDALWLPGGYPELHHQALAANQAMRDQIREFYRQGKKILAECGGMLYLMDTLTDVDGNTAEMVGLMPGQGIMRDRGGCQGMQYAPLPEGEIRAHAHHRTRCENTMEPISHGRRLRHPAPGEPIYQKDNLTASYLHFYFPSNPEAIARLLS